MRFFALATDYDNTLASDGRVANATWDALERLRASGRQAILVSGREMDDLLEICPRLDLFSRVVAENGGVLYTPSTGTRRLLAPPPPPAFVDELRRRGLAHFSVSETLVATMKPAEQIALAVIRDLGLGLQIIFNGEAVMIVSPGISKASGLREALDELTLSPFNVVGVGDAENDHALLDACGFSVAVANALPALKEHADMVTSQAAGAGVAELVDALVKDDLHERASTAQRSRVLIGHAREAVEATGATENTKAAGATGATGATQAPDVYCAAHGSVVLLAGESGCGKSTACAGLLERLAGMHQLLCIIDPEGDYQNDDETMVVGDAHTAPLIDEIVQLLLRPPRPAIAVNLLRVPLAERPAFCASLLLEVQQLRMRTGRPHWLVFDEAHHLFPAGWAGASQTIPQTLETALAITVSPQQLDGAFLRQVNLLLAMGPSAGKAVQELAKATDRAVPQLDETELETGQALLWRLDSPAPEGVIRLEPGSKHRLRHRRKYAEGLLIPERSFYFRGPEQALNLRAHNLVLFVEIAEGVDARTWQYHRERGDYSRWFDKEIGDPDLAAQARQIEQDASLDAAESLARIKAAVQERYTQPENPSMPAVLTAKNVDAAAEQATDGGGQSRSKGENAG
ncbi:haloacid dehalogenase [bacterium M00.F.Ca.ET.228.01.1.1]|uniref:HAD family hydrolase n=1 Tax=Paraburkholderia phenoliruptrix TaxID=252970 RepID=UPI0010921617|nr:HAD family hydrolase [Paraburkholderia phenoliruptrix]TGP40000.1 haloacid dehalogenase [bacterium M00.F.Ca.ET.228.01.1.1]TGR95934.1 haloacid dehalogenase [bacterium M00.F.Ca.ET.191.01.1.1]TGT97039.1 haloacid dehalogenase [bacterium M00.F.Ca.ET.155.01.1.1]MBW0448708.1 HAD hydrolase family protein [Paraburkholderia phenoliruptrix]MBW9100430.1 HAD hydrolase family protein [Paraburkholderia phenoliruptrix]